MKVNGDVLEELLVDQSDHPNKNHKISVCIVCVKNGNAPKFQCFIVLSLLTTPAANQSPIPFQMVEPESVPAWLPSALQPAGVVGYLIASILPHHIGWVGVVQKLVGESHHQLEPKWHK